MIKKILIANRGEIAVRIIRACKELGIETVAVYSVADKESLHVKYADYAFCIGPASSKESYLNIQALLTIALASGCEAVHPGVGFLSENADFAQNVETAGLFWIGPSPETIELLGNKVKARLAACKSGLTVIPGSDTAISIDDARQFAALHGYPVIIKAACGGGGKGMRIVYKESELAKNFDIAASEAHTNFGNDAVYIEKYLVNPRHIEVQVMGNGKGGVAVLGERECSVQKKHQKLIEESPSPAVDDSLRKILCTGASALFSSIKYRGAGTIEFLIQDKNCYFMEVNARIQVEHPVSEMVSGIDIIAEQIKTCTGIPMSLAAGVYPMQGCAMEARINAYTPGKITNLQIPGGHGVRFDSFLYNGYTVVPFYDSMIAKLIVHGTNRSSAIRKMCAALDELVIEGIITNSAEQKQILQSEQFESGCFDTGLYETLFPA